MMKVTVARTMMLHEAAKLNERKNHFEILEVSEDTPELVDIKSKLIERKTGVDMPRF